MNFLQWYGLISITKSKKPVIEKATGFDKLKFTVKHTTKDYDLEILSTKTAYRVLRDELLLNKEITKPKVWIYLTDLSEHFFRDIYKLPFDLCQDSVSQAFQYLFLNDCLVNNYWLTKWKIKSDERCYLCQSSAETLTHLFWECSEMQTFLKDVQNWCSHYNLVLSLSKQNLFLGNPGLEHIENIIFILIKRHVYLSKLNDRCKNIQGFQGFLKNYINKEFYIAKEKMKVSTFNERWGLFTNII
jgi:hypothetical protein